jgi:hypothetical protein
MNSTHPDYDVAAAEWSRTRKAFAGEDSVKTAVRIWCFDLRREFFPNKKCFPLGGFPAALALNFSYEY